ncbi:hypothetical protein B0T16DRAFT_423232 [Cercophora newfieldiana]|uniref:Secreted protein n=1 Tax=Cercophora newfieldiana TaxID=92897 RepID=A0AA39XTN7_9PEZI|nr:hypothetical protein B0T16DRAFT_423232 [Cercophora newfieldiana]
MLHPIELVLLLFGVLVKHPLKLINRMCCTNAIHRDAAVHVWHHLRLGLSIAPTRQPPVYGPVAHGAFVAASFVAGFLRREVFGVVVRWRGATLRGVGCGFRRRGRGATGMQRQPHVFLHGRLSSSQTYPALIPLGNWAFFAEFML